MNNGRNLLLAWFFFLPSLAFAEIGPVWLTHRSNDPAKLCVNWLTGESVNSVVRFGSTAEIAESVIEVLRE
jgi:hypothetical protein